MILSTHGFFASSIGQFDADAVAFFTRVTTAGGTLSATERNAVNTLVIQMKTDGIWTKMKAIYPMVGASAAACAQNLKSSSFTGTFSSGWTFASTGVTPNGTSAFMNTNLTPSISLSQNDTHISVYSRTNQISSGALIGNENDTQPQLNIFPTFGSNLYMRVNSVGTSQIVANTSSLGLFIANRVSSTGTRNFQNTTLRTQTANSTGLSNVPIHLSRQGSSNFGSFQIAFSSIGDGITDTEASNFYTAVQAMQTTLSRNV